MFTDKEKEFIYLGFTVLSKWFLEPLYPNTQESRICVKIKTVILKYENKMKDESSVTCWIWTSLLLSLDLLLSHCNASKFTINSSICPMSIRTEPLSQSLIFLLTPPFPISFLSTAIKKADTVMTVWMLPVSSRACLANRKQQPTVIPVNNKNHRLSSAALSALLFELVMLINSDISLAGEKRTYLKVFLCLRKLLYPYHCDTQLGATSTQRTIRDL